MPQTQDKDKKNTIEFEGQTHEFPSDFTDDDIQQALSSLSTTSAASPKVTPPPKPNSVTGGFFRRGWDTVKGAVSGLNPNPQDKGEGIAATVGGVPGTVLYRAGKGIVNQEVEAGKQAVSQIGQGKYGRAARTVFGMNPLTVGTTVDTNKLIDEGRYREAIGTEAFDAVTALLSAVTGEKASAKPTRSTVAKLTSVIGPTGETAADVKTILPDLEQTIKTTGKKPVSIGELKTTVQDTFTKLDQEFNQALYPIRGKQVMPVGVSQRIDALITPNLKNTAAGRAEAAALKRASLEFQKPWSLEDLDFERRRRNAALRSYYNKQSGAQSAAVKSDVDLAIDKAVRDGAADTVYSELDRQNPGKNFTDLKQKESAIWHLRDQIDDRIGELEDKQMEREGRLTRENIRPHAYVSHSGPRAHVAGFVESLPGMGPEKIANKKVSSAFQSHSLTPTRAVIMGLPVERLAGRGTASSKKLPPPPREAPEDDQ
jgi:hypothetical protein